MIAQRDKSDFLFLNFVLQIFCYFYIARRRDWTFVYAKNIYIKHEIISEYSSDCVYFITHIHTHTHNTPRGLIGRVIIYITYVSYDSKFRIKLALRKHRPVPRSQPLFLITQ